MGGLWALNSQLLVAIQNNDVSSMKCLLEQGVDADIRFCIGSQNRPAVCICVERGSLPLVTLLVDWGCSINQRDSGGISPLHLAASYGHASLVSLLLRNRADINAISDLGATPLHLASQRGCADIVALLLSAGADVNRTDQKGQSSLVQSCIQGHSEVAGLLVQHGANVNVRDEFGNTPLLLAASAAQLNVDVIRTLIEGGASVCPNVDGETPLHAVIRGRRTNKESALKILIGTGCMLDYTTNLGHTPLHLAVLEKEDTLVRILIGAGCEINTRDELDHSPLYHVIKENRRSLVDLLLSAGARASELNPRQIEDEHLRFLLEQSAAEVPTLLSLCRRTFKSVARHRADTAVQDLRIPTWLKHYLRFEIL